MNYFLFYIMQALVFSIGFIVYVFMDLYVLLPLNKMELFVICSFAVVYTIVSDFLLRLYKTSFKIRILPKILISITAFISAILLMGAILSVWLEG